MLPRKFALILIFSIILTLGLSVSLSSILAWTAPASDPPDGNVFAPLNVGDLGQIKQGSLILNTDGDYDTGLVVSGNVGIGTGTSTPGEDLGFAENVLEIKSVSQDALFLSRRGGSLIRWWDGPYVGLLTSGFGIYSYDEDLLFQSWYGGAVQDRMTIAYDTGNVGIGKAPDAVARLDVNGNIIASTPTANNHVATKAYVDSAVEAAGGGTCSSDSVQEGRWFSVGGEPRYCVQKDVNSTGLAVNTNINQWQTCGLNSEYCFNGQCEDKQIIVAYIDSSHNGGMGGTGGRTGMDNYCAASMPTGCSNPRALVSINAADEIKDIPTNYGYSIDKGIYWRDSVTGFFTKMANDWADMLDGTIMASAMTGLPNQITWPMPYWTGSTSDGSFDVNYNNCSGFTVGQVGWAAEVGKADRTNSTWLDSNCDGGTACGCADSRYHLCLCEY
ncbi:MAG: hypothetical protein PHR36_04765 [Patescibacteria group bacterium]|nr:hypothetical protein [Patescibacteria group bacterium]